MMLRYFIIYKPFGVLSQFSPETGKSTLKDFFPVPKDVYPVGRLDYDSEGLLILTNDRTLNHRLLNPRFAHEREYRVQTEGIPTREALEQLEHGLPININGKIYQSRPCQASLFRQAPPVPDRHPPVRFRKNIPTAWIKLVLKEGKNRQVRKMTAKAGFPTLRLIRYRIEQLTLQDLQPGAMKEMKREEIYDLLFGKATPGPKN